MLPCNNLGDGKKCALRRGDVCDGRDNEGTVVFACPKFRVVEMLRRVQTLSETREQKIWFVEADPWTRIVPIDSGGNLILLRERRASTGEWVWRLPGGRIEPEEDPKAAAAREMSEEIGLEAGNLELLFVEEPTVSWYHQRGYVYLATELRPSTTSAVVDFGEEIAAVPTRVTEVLRMADDGKFDAWIEKSIRHAVLRLKA